MWRIGILTLVFLAACSPQANDDSGLPTLAALPDVAPLVIDEAVKLLEFWEAKAGLMSGEDSVDIWQFVGKRDDAITLRVIGHDVTVSMTLQADTGLKGCRR